MRTERITRKWLSNWVDQQMIKFEIPFRVTEIHTTRFTGDQYESGATKLIIRLNHLEEGYSPISIYSLYTLKEIQLQIGRGHQIKIDFTHNSFGTQINESWII